MQVMPFWLKELKRPHDNLFHAETNLRMGCTILKYYLDREKGDLVKALARYNGSYGRPKYPYKVLEALNKRWFRE
jgi:soluble lytic murein transglycosylase-like protein